MPHLVCKNTSLLKQNLNELPNQTHNQKHEHQFGMNQNFQLLFFGKRKT